MLIDLLDRVTGRISKRWLIGRRLILDLSEANESRIAVMELPSGSFSFDIRDLDGKFEVVLLSEAGTRVVATYSSRALATKASKRIKFAMTRPLKKLALTCLGLLIVLFGFDIATTPKGDRVAIRSAAPVAAQLQAGSSKAQLDAMLRQRILNQAPVSAMPAEVTTTTLTEPTAAASRMPGQDLELQGSPEAQAAIRLLKGK